MEKWFALNKPAAWIVIAAMAVGIGVWRRLERDGHQLSFRMAVVKRGDVEAIISSSGTIEPLAVMDVRAQEASLIKTFGTDINDKPIDYGLLVEKGAVLATIDDPDWFMPPISWWPRRASTAM